MNIPTREEEVRPLNVVPVLCAWCLAEQGLPAGEGSHGICKKHANMILLQYRATRVARKGN